MAGKGPRGMLSVAQLREEVAEGRVETVVVGFTDMYGRLMGKRFDAEFFLETCVRPGGGTHACNYLLALDIDMEPVKGYKFASWEQGCEFCPHLLQRREDAETDHRTDGDFQLAPDLQTLRTASWLDKTAMVQCDVANELTQNLMPHAPRSILKLQVGRAALQGFTAMAASELEYFIYKTSYKDAFKQGYRDLEAMGWHNEDYSLLQGTREEVYTAKARRHLAQSGVPVENSKGETGVSQHELNVRYTDILQMADRHVVFKQCLKEVADANGVSVTFMAKPEGGQAGNSCHIHLVSTCGRRAGRGGGLTGKKVPRTRRGQRVPGGPGPRQRLQVF